MWKLLVSIPVFILICALVHELGHFVGCKIKGREVYEIRIPFFCWKRGKLAITSRVASCCIFEGKEENLLIFTLGPVFSFVYASIWLLLFLCFKNDILFCYFCLATAAFLINMIPARNSDMQKIIEGLKKLHDN
jgi:hypothetical protein